jgi:hypothetical protein
MAIASVSRGPFTLSPMRAQSSRDRARAAARASMLEPLARRTAPLPVIGWLPEIRRGLRRPRLRPRRIKGKVNLRGYTVCDTPHTGDPGVTCATAAPRQTGNFSGCSLKPLGPQAGCQPISTEGQYGHRKEARVGEAFVREEAAGAQGRVQRAYQDQGGLQEHQAEAEGTEGNPGGPRRNQDRASGGGEDLGGSQVHYRAGCRGGTRENLTGGIAVSVEVQEVLGGGSPGTSHAFAASLRPRRTDGKLSAVPPKGSSLHGPVSSA